MIKIIKDRVTYGDVLYPKVRMTPDQMINYCMRIYNEWKKLGKQKYVDSD